MTKQEKTAINMARLPCWKNSTSWTRTNRQTSANHFTTTPTNSTVVASHASAMTVKATETCSSRRRSQLACERMPGADKPVRARQRVLAGVGAQP